MKRLTPLLLVTAVALNGCADRLNFEHKFTLTHDGEKSEKLLNTPVQSTAQTVKVQVTADEPIDVFVFLTKDVPQPLDLLITQRSSNAFSSKQGVTAETLTVAIPAKTDYSILIALSEKSKKSNVTVKLTN